MTTDSRTAADGQQFAIRSNDQDWIVAWHLPPTPPDGMPHGAEGICVTPEDKIVLISEDGERWASPPAAQKEARPGRRRFVARCSRRRMQPRSARGCSDLLEVSASRVAGRA
jgi:hypothetical protein